MLGERCTGMTLEANHNARCTWFFALYLTTNHIPRLVGAHFFVLMYICTAKRIGWASFHELMGFLDLSSNKIPSSHLYSNIDVPEDESVRSAGWAKANWDA